MYRGEDRDSIHSFNLRILSVLRLGALHTHLKRVLLALAAAFLQRGEVQIGAGKYKLVVFDRFVAEVPQIGGFTPCPVRLYTAAELLQSPRDSRAPPSGQHCEKIH